MSEQLDVVTDPELKANLANLDNLCAGIAVDRLTFLTLCPPEEAAVRAKMVAVMKLAGIHIMKPQDEDEVKKRNELLEKKRQLEAKEKEAKLQADREFQKKTEQATSSVGSDRSFDFM
jgi:hypothetical protein